MSVPIKHVHSYSQQFAKQMHGCMHAGGLSLKVGPINKLNVCVRACMCVNTYIYIYIYIYAHTHTNMKPYKNLFLKTI